MNTAMLFASAVVVVITAQVLTACHRRLRPSDAAWMCSAVLSMSTLALVGVIGHMAVAGLVALPRFGPIIHDFAHRHGVHTARGVILGLVPLGFLIVGGVRCASVVKEFRTLARTSGQSLNIVSDESPFAFAHPGSKSAITMSQGLIDLLTPEEIGAVMAHEQAHLSARHDRHLLLARICHRFAPVLHVVVNRLTFSLERWADDVAAGRFHRHVVAQALTKSATGVPLPSSVVGISGGNVAARITMLLDPHPHVFRRGPSLGIAVMVIATAAVVSGVMWIALARAIATQCGL